MGTLAEAFAAEAVKRKDEQVWQTLGRVVELALFPFKPGHVTMELDSGEGYSDRSRTLWITVDLLPRYTFRYKFDEWTLHQAYDPELYLVESIRGPLFQHFRYRPSLPVDDHIVLGDT